VHAWTRGVHVVIASGEDERVASEAGDIVEGERHPDVEMDPSEVCASGAPSGTACGGEAKRTRLSPYTNETGALRRHHTSRETAPGEKVQGHGGTGGSSAPAEAPHQQGDRAGSKESADATSSDGQSSGEHMRATGSSCSSDWQSGCRFCDECEARGM